MVFCVIEMQSPVVCVTSDQAISGSAHWVASESYFLVCDWQPRRFKQLHVKFLQTAVAADGVVILLRMLVVALLLLGAFALQFIRMIHSGRIIIMSVSSCVLSVYFCHCHLLLMKMICLNYKCFIKLCPIQYHHIKKKLFLNFCSCVPNDTLYTVHLYIE